MSLNNPIWKFKDFIDIDKLSFPILSRNRYSIDYLYENEEDIDWYELSSNKYAMDIIENNLDKIDWCEFSINRNLRAIKILEDNPNKINWMKLSGNSNAIELLEKNKSFINWKQLSKNPSIFTYDYQIMMNNRKDLHNELLERILHPDNLEKLINKYGYNVIYDTYYY